jgi:hypothetical protein
VIFGLFLGTLGNTAVRDIFATLGETSDNEGFRGVPSDQS